MEETFLSALEGKKNKYGENGQMPIFKKEHYTKTCFIFVLFYSYSFLIVDKIPKGLISNINRFRIWFATHKIYIRSSLCFKMTTIWKVGRFIDNQFILISLITWKVEWMTAHMVWLWCHTEDLLLSLNYSVVDGSIITFIMRLYI